ncbi:hypothetical protein DNHGIG_28070 [Collibacillus ludicampi]|jgi:hypothetical protein|uniref:Transposase n=1 Tax=Collibacillus ludicampi TaxID=2771369 RepID=A0AAV4LHL0_9BACL|nr:hypothetical protein [Collibacillus ludicampi]GIM47258.1 hypothetical protein DNHGIG_28070 [Collibacillus ludicampi]
MPGPVEERLIEEIYGLFKHRIIKENDRLLNEMMSETKRLEKKLDDLLWELKHLGRAKSYKAKKRPREKHGKPKLWI